MCNKMMKRIENNEIDFIITNKLTSLNNFFNFLTTEKLKKMVN